MTLFVYELIWAVSGFVLGFVSCWLLVKVSMLPRSERRKFVLKRTKAEVLRGALGVLILCMGLFASIQYYRVTSCQSKYNAAVAEALSQRSEAQRVTSMAQISLLTATLQGNREASAKAISDYIQSLKDLEEVRAATPYPQPAKCGEF